MAKKQVLVRRPVPLLLPAHLHAVSSVDTCVAASTDRAGAGAQGGGAALAWNRAVSRTFLAGGGVGALGAGTGCDRPIAWGGEGWGGWSVCEQNKAQAGRPAPISPARLAAARAAQLAGARR